MKGKNGSKPHSCVIRSYNYPNRNFCYICRWTNPYDPNLAILKVSDLPTNRRFMVQAFQFMDQATNQYLNEEVSQSIKEALLV